MKIKCKLEDPMVERMAAVREAVPGHAGDGRPQHPLLPPEDAAGLARRLGAIGNVAVFEDPIPKEDFGEYARLRREMQGTGIPLALHLGRVDDLRRAIDGGCIDVVNASPPSMVAFVEMARLAGEAGDPLLARLGERLRPDGSVLRPRLRRCAGLHPAERHHGQPPARRALPGRADRLRRQPGAAPRRPGLGGELDMAAVERQAIGRGVVTA